MCMAVAIEALHDPRYIHVISIVTKTSLCLSLLIKGDLQELGLGNTCKEFSKNV